MKYLKYGFYAVVKKPLFNILIMLEIAAILIVGNMAVAVFNSRSVLYEPYADILSQDGYLFFPKSSKEVLGSYDENLIIKKMYDSLKGDITIVHTYILQLIYGENYKNLVVIDPEIFSKFRLPLLEGRWASCEKNSEGQIEVVVSQGDNTPELNTVLDTQYGPVKVVGIIAVDSYYPDTNDFNNDYPDVRNFYSVVGEDGNKECEYYAASSADEALSDPHWYGKSNAFIYYNSEPNKEDHSYNEEVLMANSMILHNLSEINDASLEYINEQYIKLLPVLLCVFIIVLAELICSVAMNTRSQMRNYGIYFLCGCRWKGCLKISLAYSAIILVGGGILGTVGFLLFQSSEYAALFEQNMAVNNLYITLAIIVLMLILSLIIPFFQVQKTSPVETVKENR